MILYEFSGGYDPLDPNGNITVKWDILDWNDGTYDVIFMLIHLLCSSFQFIVFFVNL